MGALENKARTSDQPTKKLIVRGSAVMGSVEIKD
jgi:hypothetical protein